MHEAVLPYLCLFQSGPQTLKKQEIQVAGRRIARVCASPAVSRCPRQGNRQEFRRGSNPGDHVRMLGEHLGVAVCAYADMDDDKDGFTIRGNWNAPEAISIVGHYSLAAFGKLAVHTLHAGLPLVLNDNRAQLPPEEAATFLYLGLAATICMPLVKEGKLTVLMAVHDRVPRSWTADDRAIVNEVTGRSWGSHRTREAFAGPAR
jgi:GAF domain-containing protein